MCSQLQLGGDIEPLCIWAEDVKVSWWSLSTLRVDITRSRQTEPCRQPGQPSSLQHTPDIQTVTHQIYSLLILRPHYTTDTTTPLTSHLSASHVLIHYMVT